MLIYEAAIFVQVELDTHMCDIDNNNIRPTVFRPKHWNLIFKNIEQH